MSSLIVKIVKINKIEKHPNADRLQIAYMEDNDWSVVIGLNQFKVGDLAIYVPVDSLLDEKLENYLFPLDSKIKLNNHRVRAIKIRSYISVGMFVELTQELISLYPELSKKKSGEDVASLLNIQKYEPPIRNLPKNMQGRIAKRNHSLFKKYTDIENIKFFTNVILIDEMVQISEKCHGSNSRYAVLPTETISFWNKIKKFLRLLPKKEFLIGSHNIQLNINKKLYYDRNIYAIIAKQYDIKNKLKLGEEIFGEIYGLEVQKNYGYGLKNNELRFLAFDVMKDGKYLNYQDFINFCDERNIPRVPVIFIGKFGDANLQELSTGKSIIGDQPIKEGCVVKPLIERLDRTGRVVYKSINTEYLLLKDVEDWH